MHRRPSRRRCARRRRGRPRPCARRAPRSRGSRSTARPARAARAPAPPAAPAANASPCTMPQAMRTPVNEPGPWPKPKASICRALEPRALEHAADHRYQQLRVAVFGQRLPRRTARRRAAGRRSTAPRRFRRRAGSRRRKADDCPIIRDRNTPLSLLNFKWLASLYLTNTSAFVQDRLHPIGAPGKSAPAATSWPGRANGTARAYFFGPRTSRSLRLLALARCAPRGRRATRRRQAGRRGSRRSGRSASARRGSVPASARLMRPSPLVSAAFSRSDSRGTRMAAVFLVTGQNERARSRPARSRSGLQRFSWMTPFRW